MHSHPAACPVSRRCRTPECNRTSDHRSSAQTPTTGTSTGAGPDGGILPRNVAVPASQRHFSAAPTPPSAANTGTTRTPCHGSYRAGTSRHVVPARIRHRIPSMSCRFVHFGERPAFLPRGSSGTNRAHCTSVTSAPAPRRWARGHSTAATHPLDRKLTAEPPLKHDLSLGVQPEPIVAALDIGPAGRTVEQPQQQLTRRPSGTGELSPG